MEIMLKGFPTPYSNVMLQPLLFVIINKSLKVKLKRFIKQLTLYLNTIG